MLTADATVVLYLAKFSLLVVTIDICHNFVNIWCGSKPPNPAWAWPTKAFPRLSLKTKNETMVHTKRTSHSILH